MRRLVGRREVASDACCELIDGIQIACLAELKATVCIENSGRDLRLAYACRHIGLHFGHEVSKRDAVAHLSAVDDIDHLLRVVELGIFDDRRRDQACCDQCDGCCCIVIVTVAAAMMSVVIATVAMIFMVFGIVAVEVWMAHDYYGWAWNSCFANICRVIVAASYGLCAS